MARADSSATRLQFSGASPRYVELVRVSSKGQADRDTPERQRRALDQLRVARPGILVERIEAIASATLPLDQTIQGRRLAHLAKTRSFDELRVSEHDRVLGGRADDPLVRFALLSVVLDAGAIIVDASSHVIDPADESGMGELDYYLRTFFAARERKLIVRRTTQGRLRHAAEGHYVGLGHYPWWLSWDAAAKKCLPVQERVALLVKVGEWRLKGISLSEAVRRLNAEGIPAPRGPRWHVITLDRMLRNRALIGEHYQSLDGQRFPLPVPPVVESAWFDRLQRVLDGGRGKRRRESYKARALCRGLAFCGVCSQPMQLVQGTASSSHQPVLEYFYYRCRTHDPNQRSKFTRCANLYHRVVEVDGAVWSQVTAMVLDDKVRRRAAKLSEDDDPQVDLSEAERLRAALKKVDNFQVHLLRQKASELISDEVYERMLTEQAEKRAALQSELRLVEKRISDTSGHRQMLESLDARMSAIAANIPDADFETRRSLLEGLVPAEASYGVFISDGKIEIRGILLQEDASRAPTLLMSPPSSE